MYKKSKSILDDYIAPVVGFSCGTSVLLFFLSTFIESEFILISAAILLLPLLALLTVGLGALVMDTLYDLLPEFPGKDATVIFISLAVVVFFILAVTSEGGGGYGSCSSYRGEPTC